MAKKAVKLACPECGTIFELEYGFFSMTGKCPKCSHKINIKQESMQTVTCENCRNDVIYDAKKGDGQLCPVCGKPLKSKLMEKRFEVVLCPRCQSPNEAKSTDEFCTCGVCGYRIPVQTQLARQGVGSYSSGLVITAPEQEDFIIWNHPLNRFPYSSQLIVPEGMTALLRRNGRCNQPALPGRYTLSDSRLDLGDQLERAVAGSEEQLTVDIFFVRNRFSRSMLWGGAQGAVENEWGQIAGVISGRGELTLRIVDSLRFAENFGYRTMKEDDLIWVRDVEPYEESPLCTRVRKAAYDGLFQAACELVRQFHWTFEQVRAHRLEIMGMARDRTDMLLAPLGLRTESFSVEEVFFREDPQEIRRKANRDQLVQIMEQQNRWSSIPIEVHMKDRPALSAKITLEGDYKLRVTDEAAFMGRTEIRSWIENGFRDADVKDYCSRMINEQAKNVYLDVLQPMIDNLDADVRELYRYFRYLRETVENTLNGKLAAYGLQVEQFSMEQRGMAPSTALAQRTSFIHHKEESEIAQEVREYNNQMDLKRTAADSQTEVKKTAIELQRDSELDALKQQRETMASQQEARRAQLELDAMKRQREMDQLKKSWQRYDAQDEASYAHQQAVTDLKQRNELDELSHDYRLRGKVRSAEEVRTEWEQRRQMEDAQLEAELRRQETALNGELHQKQIVLQSGHRNEQLEAENRQAVQDIMRKIAESDLGLKEKLDAYERLCRSQRVQDENEALTGTAKAKADSMYSLEHMRLLLTREQSGLMEEMDRMAEEREERKKDAEFQREMKREEAQVLHDMEKLKLEYEQAQKTAEMEERLIGQQTELEKLRLLLNNYEALGRQDAAVKIASVNAEAMRAKAEKDYEHTRAQADREEAQRMEQARSQKENDLREQAERLLTRMWEIQSALGQMNIQADVAKAQSQSAAEAAKARGSDQQIKDLIEAMEKMAKGMNSLLKQDDNFQRPVQPQPPVRPQTPFDPFWQPGIGTRICPKCGRPVPQFSALCQCGQNLG